MQLAEQAICYASERVENRIDELIHNLNKPSAIFKPTLQKHGDKWLAIYGQAVGVGESPGEAMYHFDLAWEKRIGS